MDAIILAGGKDNGSLKEQHKLNNKALLMIKNIPMVEYVVDALRMAKEVDKIIVVGPRDELVPYIGEKVTEVIDASDSIVKNIEIGINYLNDDRIIILTSDVPLITGEIIDNFIKKCQKHNASLFYPFISKEIILKKYPNTIRSYANLKEGNLCGGNLVIISSSLFNQNKALLNALYQNRKDVKK
jgi:molybdopterin-guanine dinucleotide biosynthesis protein A